MSGLQGAAVIKRKHSTVGADNGRLQSGQNLRVRFQVEERPEKRRLVIPEDFTPVRQSCVVNPGAVASGQQELWLIQLPNLAALQNLAATGSIEVDSSILQLVGHSSASIGSLPSFQCHDGLSYKLVPEVNSVAKQLITICPMENEEGEAQAVSVSRRLTLVRDQAPPETGSTAGEPEDVEAALARLDASLAAMGAARREAAAAAGGAIEVDDGRADVGASAAAGGAGRSDGKRKPSNNDLQKEERSDKRSGKKGEGVEVTHKEKHKEKDKKKDKDKVKHQKSKLAQTPGVVPAIRGTEMKQPPATAPPAMRAPAAAETPATAPTAVETPPAGAASTGKKDKHKDKKQKDKDKRDKDKKRKDKKKKDKKEKDQDKKAVKKDSSSETDSDSD
ncbi:hypothetical protein VaNZ11_001758 [Volvox africanus]|uniref:Uncharacterized protein n=1 Tax=Volvox africanus TaxID=51714 RepID=A0ABQ5RRB6_9CHLO|nr:hypothetical protein VaNZ11_001758 [Volvox africanus]